MEELREMGNYANLSVCLCLRRVFLSLYFYLRFEKKLMINSTYEDDTTLLYML